MANIYDIPFAGTVQISFPQFKSESLSDYRSLGNFPTTEAAARPVDANPSAAPSQDFDSFEEFSASIAHEFTVLSLIDPVLYPAVTRLVKDTQPLPGYDVAYPIHENLNWELPRFGRQARETLYAALLINEDGSCWQAKLSKPRLNKKKTKKRLKKLLGRKIQDDEVADLIKHHPECREFQKYEAPVGNGSRVYRPPVPPEIRRRIGKCYGIAVPEDGSFWDWLEGHPEIPIIVTEGGKKALALLSQGYVALALYGVNGGYNTDTVGKRSLIPDLAKFATKGRRFEMAFDQDTNLNTQIKVGFALIRLANLLKRATEVEPKIIVWHPEQGKGIDDLIVQAGADELRRRHSAAESLTRWGWRWWNSFRLRHSASLKIDTHDLNTLNLDDIPTSGVIGALSAKGTGKTNLIARFTKFSPKLLVLVHRVVLGRNLGSRLGAVIRNDIDKGGGTTFNSRTGEAIGVLNRLTLCVDSLLSINLEDWKGCDLVIDEVVQVLFHLLTSATCNKNGQRPVLLARLHWLIKNAKRVIVADADLNSDVLYCFSELRGEAKEPVFLIVNSYKSQGYPCRFITSTNISAVCAEVLRDIKNGKKIYITCDNRKTANALAARIEAETTAKVRVISSDTTPDNDTIDFVENINTRLIEVDVLICTPALATGVSIETPWFDKVYGIFDGGVLSDAECSQSLIRVRQLVPRVVWVKRVGNNFCKVSRSSDPREIQKILKDKHDITTALIRTSLNPDQIPGGIGFSWKKNPYIDLWSRFQATQNQSMWNLRDYLLFRLEEEGHHIEIVEGETDSEMKDAMKQQKELNKSLNDQDIIDAPTISTAEVWKLQGQATDPTTRASIAKAQIADFYAVEPDDVDREMLSFDNGGKARIAIMRYEMLRDPDLAIRRDVQAIERQAQWKAGLWVPDLPMHTLEQKARELLGLSNFLDPDKEYSYQDLEPLGALMRNDSRRVKLVFGFNIPEGANNIWIFRRLCQELGIKTEKRRLGAGGKKGAVVHIVREELEQLDAIIQRRAVKRANRDRGGATPSPVQPHPQCNPIPSATPSTGTRDSQIESSSLLLESPVGQAIEASATPSPVQPPSINKSIQGGVTLQSPTHNQGVKVGDRVMTHRGEGVVTLINQGKYYPIRVDGLIERWVCMFTPDELTII